MGFMMFSPIRHAAVLWCLAAMLSALSLPAISDNNTSPNLILTASLANLTAPDPVPGLTVKYVDWRHVLLPQTQMMINAIEMMVYLTELPFESLVVRPVFMTGKRFSTEIMIDLSPMPQNLPIRYAALALLQMGKRMTMERTYFLQWGRIVFGGLQCGILRFQQRSDPEKVGSLIQDSAPLNISNTDKTLTIVAPDEIDVTGNSSSAGLGDDLSTGTISDSKNKELVVGFKFKGAILKGSEVFMCFLDALATATDHDSRSVGASINSYSGTFDTWLHVMHLDSPRYYRQGLNWGTLVRVLTMIWEQLIMGNSPGRRGLKPRYQGLEFEVFNAGEKIGAGDLWSIGLKDVATSK